MHWRAERTTRRALLLGLSATMLLSACETTPPPPPPPPPMATPAPATPADQIAGMTARGIVLAVNFDLDRYAIRDDARPVLTELAAALMDPRLQSFTFDINGHTDVTGTLGHNVALSELRAAAVVDFLAGQSVPRTALKPQGFGPLQLLLPADPRSPANRRVEVFAIPPGPPSTPLRS